MDKNNDLINKIFEKLDKTGYESFNEEEKNLFLEEIEDLLNTPSKDKKGYIEKYEYIVYNLLLANKNDELVKIFFKAFENNYFNLIEDLFLYNKLFIQIKDEKNLKDNREYYNNVLEILSKNTNIIKDLF